MACELHFVFFLSCKSINNQDDSSVVSDSETGNVFFTHTIISPCLLHLPDSS